MSQAKRMRKYQQVQEEAASRNYVQMNTKPCPGCMSNVEKDGGWYVYSPDYGSHISSPLRPKDNTFIHIC